MVNSKLISCILLLFIICVSLSAQDAPAAEKKTAGSIYNNGKMDFATSKITFSLTSQDALSDIKSLMFKVDAGTYAEYKSPISIQDEGLHTIYYYSIDNVGNQAAEASYSVFIDNTAPEVMLVSSTKLFSKDSKLYAPGSAEFTINANDIGSGLKSTEYSLDTGAYTPYTAPITVNTTGEHTIKYKAVDNLGNASSEKSLAVFIDSNKPLVKVTPSGTFFEKDGKKIAPASFQYSIEATDTESQVAEVLVSVDGGKFVLYESPLVLSSEGEHTIKAKAIDNVGNESDEVALTVTVDSTPPKVELKPSN